MTLSSRISGYRLGSGIKSLNFSSFGRYGGSKFCNEKNRVLILIKLKKEEMKEQGTNGF